MDVSVVLCMHAIRWDLIHLIILYCLFSCVNRYLTQILVSWCTGLSLLVTSWDHFLNFVVKHISHCLVMVKKLMPD